MSMLVDAQKWVKKARAICAEARDPHFHVIAHAGYSSNSLVHAYHARKPWHVPIVQCRAQPTMTCHVAGITSRAGRRHPPASQHARHRPVNACAGTTPTCAAGQTWACTHA